MMELLCPAGDRDALIAAASNGADAVYLGAQTLNARRGAGNFDADGLLWAAEYCHERGLRLYVTVNTVVKQAELPILEDIAAQLARSGADAAIVQDLGAASLLRQMVPGLEIHASTQMAVHNRRGVQFCRAQGFDRVVLAREMSDAEIAACADVGPELEVFAHGALCVSCSGQCLFSSLVGGRSGNRGMCAQPCRLPYRMGDAVGYLLSPKDLCQLSRLGELSRLGVRSIKIEGRLKRPEYVAIVTRIYREMLDHPHEVSAREMDALRQIFSRGGFTSGYGPGLTDSELMNPDKPNHSGIAVGEAVAGGRVRLAVDVSIKDQLMVGDEPVKLSGAAGDKVRCEGMFEQGAKLVRLADDEQLKAARASYEGVETARVEIEGRLTLRVGEPMRLWVSDGKNEAEVTGNVVARAEKRGADMERIRAQLLKTGGTIYGFAGLLMDVDAEAFAPVAAVNELRRDALERLRAKRIAAMEHGRGRLLPIAWPPSRMRNAEAYSDRPVIRVQSSSTAKLHQAAAWGADALIFAPDDLTADQLAREHVEKGTIIALPMTCSDAALDALHAWAWAHASDLAGVIASNPAHLIMDWPGTLDADFSLNAANEFAADELHRLGVRLYAPSVELTAKEIEPLPGDKELIVHGRLPLMQLRHCPLNARRKGIRHAECRACDTNASAINQQRLIDRKGVAFPLQRLKTPSGCIVRVLNSVPLSLIKHINKLPEAAAWRIILTDESDSLAASIIRTYAMAARGGDPRDMESWPDVEAIGSTTGHYFRGVE